MIELEVYAAGVRNLDKILELDRTMETIPGLRYKVDSNHDVVYFEAEEASFSLEDIRGAFLAINLVPRVVGEVPSVLLNRGDKQACSLN